MANLEQETAEVPAWDLADRMRKSLRNSKVGVQEMADYLGVSRATVGTWVNGRNRPSRPALRLWAMRCGVPYEWLISGETDGTIRTSSLTPADQRNHLAVAA